MKVKFHSSAWSNHSYEREEEVDVDMDPIDWEHMSDDEQEAFMDNELLEWLFNDICFSYEILDEPETDGTIEYRRTKWKDQISQTMFYRT